MRVQIISDIHLEFEIRKFDFSGCDLLILAGDVYLGTGGFTWISEKVKDIPVIYVLGNHEYYKNAWPKLLHEIKESAKGTNIHVLENDSVCIEGITFHGATLWTDFALFGNPEIARFESQYCMNDYKLIRCDPSYSKLRASDTQRMHNESLRWFQKSLGESTTETNVVVTHHAPSIKSIQEKDRNELISASFTSNLEDFIDKTKPDLWIHGHIHAASDYFIGKTRVICNPVGYPAENVKGYKENFIIEIST